jgi:hypothetical protein
MRHNNSSLRETEGPSIRLRVLKTKQSKAKQSKAFIRKRKHETHIYGIVTYLETGNHRFLLLRCLKTGFDIGGRACSSREILD